MPGNHVLLETINLTQSAASITFDNLPSSGYTDLKILMSGITTGSTLNCSIALNGSTSNFTSRQLGSDGTTPYSATRTDNLNVALTNGTGYTPLTGAFNELYFPNYRSTDAKSFSSETATENNATGADLVMRAYRWSPATQAAITSITLFAGNAAGSFGANSTFSLYGVAALGTTPVTAPFASGGNIVANDGTYWYHAFLTSGTFTPLKALTCDYLVVAGGGAGSYFLGGGGGGGGLRSTITQTGGNSAGVNLESTLSLSASQYAVTVGAGGAASTTTVFNNGNPSSIIGTNASITSTGGGAGGGIAGSTAGTGYNGGSGGGGGGNQSGSTGYFGGTGTSNQGYGGGRNGGAWGQGEVSGAGGGGAGSVGISCTQGSSVNIGGAGGAGVLLNIFATPTNTGVSSYYAGGGGGWGSGYPSGNGGGAGGSGGGGAAATYPSTNAVSGISNTGGGGGGGHSGYGTSGSGGSGIVIVRYPMV